MVYLAIDNGISGTIGIIDEKGVGYQLPMPIKNTLNYQKTKVKHINRIDVVKLKEVIKKYLQKTTTIRCIIERPMVNPGRFQSTASALRALEAVLIVLEEFNIGYEYVDSKTWQKVMLPNIPVQSKKDFPNELKKVSKEIGMRLFPNIDWNKFKDADGILMALFLSRLEKVYMAEK